MSAQQPRVYLVDDHAMFRAGVRAELGALVDLVGEAGTVADAVAGITRSQPDVVLLDVHLPDGGGLAVIAGVGETRVRYLALSVSDAAEDVIAIIRAMSPRRSPQRSWRTLCAVSRPTTSCSARGWPGSSSTRFVMLPSCRRSTPSWTS